MHIAIRKSLANGATSITTAGNWDGLKYQLSKLECHDTDEWDAHFAWEDFKKGKLIQDSNGLWRYFSIEMNDIYNKGIFEGKVINLFEIDPMFD
jgi:hypothetical protein